MNLRALMSNRRAQVGAGLALLVILLALMRRRQNGGDPRAASTISEQALGGDPNPAFQGPVTFADNGGYAAALGEQVTDQLGNVALALESFSGQYEAQQELLAEGLGGISSGLTGLGQQIASIPQPTPAPIPVAPVPSAAPVAAAPTPPPAAAGSWVPGPPAAPAAPVAVSGGHTRTLYQRPTGSKWDGNNVFVQDSGPRQGMWFYVFQKGGKSYRQYQDGSAPIPIK